MKCKIFAERSRPHLEKQVNAWLEASELIRPDTLQIKYQATYLEDPSEHIIEHTLIVFYDILPD